MISGLVFLQMNSDTEIGAKLADDDAKHPYDTEDAFDEFTKDMRSDILKNDIRCYYFGSSDDGSMKTGKQNVSIDGESITFKFETGSAKKGVGLNGIDDDKAYVAGKQIKADKDDKYEVVEIETINNVEYIKDEMTVAEFLDLGLVDETTNDDGDRIWDFSKVDVKNYRVINSSGAVIKKKSSAKDGDDYKLTISNKEITKIVLEN